MFIGIFFFYFKEEKKKGIVLKKKPNATMTGRVFLYDVIIRMILDDKYANCYKIINNRRASNTTLNRNRAARDEKVVKS